jgi:2,3-dihydroxybenzoate decarboxylase
MTTFENRAPPIRRVLGTIALEEAIQLPEFKDKTIQYAYNPTKWEELAEKIVDIHDIRLKKMNECGVEFFLLSWTSHGAQGYSDPKEAEKVARRANDYMSEQCKKNPKRFGGFASVSMHDPKQAADELERAIKELGLYGVILNDFQEAENGTKMLWYDQPEYDVFWAKVQELDGTVLNHAMLILSALLYSSEGTYQASL